MRIADALGNSKTILFVTQQSRLSPMALRYLLQFANGMELVGIRTAVLNVGESLYPRPDWLVSPMISVKGIDEFKEVFDYCGETINFATNWETAYMLFANLRGDNFYFVYDIDTYYVRTIAEAKLVFKSYDLGLGLFTSSVWVKDLLFEMFNRDAVLVMPPPNAVFSPSLSGERSGILYFNDQSRPSDRELFNRAFKYALERDPKLKAAIFGYGCKVEGKDESEACVSLSWEEANDELKAELYRQASCFVNTCYHDSLSLPALEAMACGCPVITTRCDGNESFCKHEHNCLMVEKGDYMGIGKAILRIMNDGELRSELVKNGLETARAYTWDHSIGQFISGIKAELGSTHVVECGNRHE